MFTFNKSISIIYVKEGDEGMKNPVNQIHKKMLEEFESKRKYNKRMIEEDVSWRKVPFEIKKIFYEAYDLTNELSDELLVKIEDSKEEFDYEIDEYFNYIMLEEEWYNLIFFSLCRKYGIDKNVLSI